jgi:hypothetical protein
MLAGGACVRRRNESCCRDAILSSCECQHRVVVSLRPRCSLLHLYTTRRRRDLIAVSLELEIPSPSRCCCVESKPTKKNRLGSTLTTTFFPFLFIYLFSPDPKANFPLSLFCLCSYFYSPLLLLAVAF